MPAVATDRREFAQNPLARSRQEYYIRIMGRILLFSDLHGNARSYELLVKRVREESVGQVICAGDLGLDRLGASLAWSSLFAVPTSIVRGNCDSPWTFTELGMQIPPRYLSQSLGERTLFVTHGDVVREWKAAPVALKEGDLFVTGHTHVARIIRHRGVPILINPGSASSSRDGRAPSFAIITETCITIGELASGRIMEKLTI